MMMMMMTDQKQEQEQQTFDANDGSSCSVPATPGDV
jgi:hypothetical protein